MAARGPSDDEKTVIGPLPVFDDDPHPSGEAPTPRDGVAIVEVERRQGARVTGATSRRGPTVTRSRPPAPEASPPPAGPLGSRPADGQAPRLQLPKPGGGAGPNLRLPPVSPGAGGAQSWTPSSVEDAADAVSPALRPDASARLDVLEVAGPTAPRFNSAGPLTALAVMLVLVVGVVFVRGTQDSASGTQVVRAVVPVAAGQRKLPARPRTWQDSFRSENPDLLVGSPKLPYLTRSPRGQVKRPPKTGRPVADGTIWTAERVENAGFPGPLPDNVAVPRYDDFESPPAEVTDIPPMVRVTSIPPGARVEAQGSVLGLTPLIRARHPDFRLGALKLSLPGYLPVSQGLTEAANGDLVLEVKLAPDPNANPVLRGERVR